MPNGGAVTMMDALTAAMSIVPRLYSRNRMFERFTDPMVRRASSRARLVRGLLRFVGRDDAEVEVGCSGTQTETRVRLRYRIARLRLERTVQLTELELSLFRMLVSPKYTNGPNAHILAEQPGDRERVESALALLPKEEISSVA